MKMNYYVILRRQILKIYIILIMTGVCFVSVAENIAYGKRYSLTPSPNYSLCKDAGDMKQLTDGKRVQANGMWTQPGCVGWGGRAAITIDLGKIYPIGEVDYSTVCAQETGIYFPELLISVSEDGIHFDPVKKNRWKQTLFKRDRKN